MSGSDPSQAFVGFVGLGVGGGVLGVGGGVGLGVGGGVLGVGGDVGLGVGGGVLGAGGDVGLGVDGDVQEGTSQKLHLLLGSVV